MIEPAQTGIQVVAAGATVAAVASTGAPDILGVPAGVLLASCAGALFGLAYTKPEVWTDLLKPVDGGRLRRCLVVIAKLFGAAFTIISTAFGCAWAIEVAPTVTLMGGLEPFAWVEKAPPVPLAGIAAFAGLRLIPPMMAAAQRWFDSRGAR